jgi:hypothetical protein
LPVGSELNVKLNQQVKGGVTVLATIDTLIPVEDASSDLQDDSEATNS